MSAMSPARYLSAGNFSSMMTQMPEFGIFALAMMMIILTGGINLSLTYVATVSGIVMAMMMSNLYAAGVASHTAILLSLLAGLAMAVGCGLLNGFLVANMHVSPILATLGTSILFEGISLNLTKGYSISGFPPEIDFVSNGRIGGLVPISLLIFVAFVIIALIMLERTPWGLRLHLTGRNEIAVNYSGVNVKKLLMQVYVFSAVLCFASAIIMMSRYNSMKVDYGSSYMMQSILAVVMGGTAITGGYGKVGGTVLAVVTLQFLSSGLNMFGLNRFFVDVVMGVLLIAVLAIHFVVDTIQNRNMLRKIQEKAEADDTAQ